VRGGDVADVRAAVGRDGVPERVERLELFVERVFVDVGGFDVPRCVIAKSPRGARGVEWVRGPREGFVQVVVLDVVVDLLLVRVCFVRVGGGNGV
jgi:hypothetical protein